MVYNKWWTDTTTLDATKKRTNSSGQYSLRCFEGLYDITVTYDGQTIILENVMINDDKVINVTLP